MRTPAVVVLAIAMNGSALAQIYPSRAVRIIAPFPAGGGTDLFARSIAQKLGASLGQQVIVDNRAGAGGMIGSEMAARAAPDGYTLLVTSSSTHAIVPHLTKKPLYDAIRDFAPVILIASAPNVLVVHPSVPARSVKELVALARSRPDQLNYASNGSGTLSHLTGEMFKLQAGVRITHIPYKGGPPALIDLVAGQVSILFTALPTASAHMRSGALRTIAVTGAKRVDALKDVATVAETLPGFESSQWWGMFGPAGLAQDIVDKLNTETARVIIEPDVKARFTTDGAEPHGGSARDFATFLRNDHAKWGKVVKAASVAGE